MSFRCCGSLPVSFSYTHLAQPQRALADLGKAEIPVKLWLAVHCRAAEPMLILIFPKALEGSHQHGHGAMSHPEAAPSQRLWNLVR
jgi:hypothetical protein